MFLLQLTSLVRPSTGHKLGDIEPLYIFTPGPAPGNCDQHKPLLESTFSEAIDMVSRSINAIDSLKMSLSELDTGERKRWKTWAQLMEAIFNIPISYSGGLDINNANVKLVKGKSFPNAAGEYTRSSGRS